MSILGLAGCQQESADCADHAGLPGRATGVLLARTPWEIVVHAPETQRTRSQVTASMTLVGSLNKILNCCEDLVAYAINRVDAVLSDEVPDLVEVDFGFWMKPEFGHSRAARRSSLFRRRRSNTSSPLIGFTSPVLISWPRGGGTVMPENQRPRAGAWADGEYREFVKKMELFENGPTTTNFAQLIAHGIQLPDPGSISDADISAKLWEVIAGLSRLRVYLDQTDHLNGRELYATLWRDVLRADVPAIDEIGSNNHVGLLSPGSEEQMEVTSGTTRMKMNERIG
jgi:hypothetical protein